MLGKAMRFATVSTFALAIFGKSNRGRTTEDLEHRFGQETNFEEHLSTTMNVSSSLLRKLASETSSFPRVRKLAAILALSSALTSADAFALPGVRPAGVRPFHKGSNPAFAPILTNNPLHGTLSGPLHVLIDQLDGERIEQMAQLLNDDASLHVLIDQLDGERIEQMAQLLKNDALLSPQGAFSGEAIKLIFQAAVHLVSVALTNVQAVVKDLQGVDFPAVGAPERDIEDIGYWGPFGQPFQRFSRDIEDIGYWGPFGQPFQRFSEEEKEFVRAIDGFWKAEADTAEAFQAASGLTAIVDK